MGGALNGYPSRVVPSPDRGPLLPAVIAAWIADNDMPERQGLDAVTQPYDFSCVVGEVGEEAKSKC
jgi:hypothetical protein